MSITSRSSKPNEWAAKINHTHLINDPFIKEFVEKCDFPREASEIDEEDKKLVFDIDKANTENPIKHILAVDGGYTTVEVKKSFPSSQIAFFQFGALLFNTEDLEALSDKPFIFPEDMCKLQKLERLKLAIPIKNVKSRSEKSLNNSIRRNIYEFFVKQRENSCFMETLKWLIFEEYKSNQKDEYVLASNPYRGIGSGSIVLRRADIKPDYTLNSADGPIYLTDVFRLHEVIDEEQGAGGILGYLTRTIEQLLLVHCVRIILINQPRLLENFLFIADGPLSFSGQTANMHGPMRELCNYLYSKENIYLVGIEKSGPFVDHAHEICIRKDGNNVLKEGSYCILSNNYIYKYIVPGDPSSMHYGSTSYYSGKVIFHSTEGRIYVLSVPTPDKNTIKKPSKSDYYNIEEVIVNIEKLKCDMYDDSIVPIALANKLISLANHPSQVILEKFATKTINHA